MEGDVKWSSVSGSASDWVTVHIWPTISNLWGFDKGEVEFGKMLSLIQQFIRCQASQAARLGKPLVVGEFGFPRELGSLSPSAGTSHRDRRAPLPSRFTPRAERWTRDSGV